MKVYFIFSIKDEFINLYKGKEISLYKILKSIYNLNKEDIEYGYTILKQITKPIDKNKIDREIYIKMHQEYPYSKRNNIHYYNQLYKDEISRLVVKKSYIKIEAEQSSSSFLELLKNYSDNYFVCDFNKINYFFL